MSSGGEDESREGGQEKTDEEEEGAAASKDSQGGAVVPALSVVVVLLLGALFVLWRQKYPHPRGDARVDHHGGGEQVVLVRYARNVIARLP